MLSFTDIADSAEDSAESIQYGDKFSSLPFAGAALARELVQNGKLIPKTTLFQFCLSITITFLQAFSANSWF